MRAQSTCRPSFPLWPSSKSDRPPTRPTRPREPTQHEKKSTTKARDKEQRGKKAKASVASHPHPRRHIAIMSTAFPRGKRKKPSSASGAAATAAASPSSSKDRPSKKRAPSSASGAAVETDFLFGSSSTGDASLRKKPSSRRRDEEDGPYDSDDEDYANAGTVASQLPLGGGAVLPPATGSNGRRVPPKIEPLTFSKYARGTKVLGSIREVRDEYALVGLPCMLAGYVRREEDGPPLTLTLPREGTMMAFAVLHAGEEAPSKKERERAAARGETARRRRRIELSPMPAHVNRGVRMEGMPREPTVVRGRIASVEDHGCMVDLGGILGGGRRAFLKFENVEGEYDVDDGEGDEEESEDDDEDGGEEHKERMDTDEKGSAKRKLNSHRVYDFTILPSHTDELPAVLQLALPSPTGLAKLRAPPSSMPVLPSLVPGMLATVRVEAHARNGLCVSFHRGVYRASLDEDHLGGHRGSGGSGKGTKGKEDGGDPHMWWRGVFKGRRAKVSARREGRLRPRAKSRRIAVRPHRPATRRRARAPMRNASSKSQVLLAAFRPLLGRERRRTDAARDLAAEVVGNSRASRRGEARAGRFDDAAGRGGRPDSKRSKGRFRSRPRGGGHLAGGSFRLPGLRRGAASGAGRLHGGGVGIFPVRDREARAGSTLRCDDVSRRSRPPVTGADKA